MKSAPTLLESILTPSTLSETPYEWAVIGIAHAVLGAAFIHATVALGIDLGSAALFWIVIYFVFKEIVIDLIWKRGLWRDSLVDTGFVALGALYGSAWWAGLVLVIAGIGAWSIQRRWIIIR